MEYEVLPKQYWHKQDYLLYAYDVLVDMLKQSDNKNLVNARLKLIDSSQADSYDNADDVFEWMDNNGFHDKSLKLFTSHVFFELLRDFCFYTYESISCAERGKVTVAYTLLRKPFRDNLLYMEWLLSDNEGFYQTFLHKDINEYDVSNPKVFTDERKQNIINAASAKTNSGDSFNGNNMIYTLRFDSKDEISLQGIWNQAMHLVTKHSNYRTDKTNLNFIFSDKDTWDRYWNYYYIAVPQIMAYVLEISESLFLMTTEVNTINILFNKLIRHSKYAQIHSELEPLKPLLSMPHDLLKFFDNYNAKVYFPCDNCGKGIIITKQLLQRVIEDWNIICPHCHQVHNICKYYTDIKYMAVVKNDENSDDFNDSE